jgi:hypothetical protein
MNVDHGERYFHAGEGLLQLVSGVGGKSSDGDYSQFPSSLSASPKIPYPPARFQQDRRHAGHLTVAMSPRTTAKYFSSFQLEKGPPDHPFPAV